MSPEGFDSPQSLPNRYNPDVLSSSWRWKRTICWYVVGAIPYPLTQKKDLRAGLGDGRNKPLQSRIDEISMVCDITPLSVHPFRRPTMPMC